MTTIIGIEWCIKEGNLPSLMSCCIFEPDPAKLDAIVERYRSDSNLTMLGCSMNGRLAGCAGVDLKAPGKTVLLHLAVDPLYRGQGVGRKMIGELMVQLSIRLLEAETDGDAVGFYRNCGFFIESLGEKYPGVVRYRCTLAGDAPVAIRV